MSNPKTITVATKDGKRRNITRHRLGWPLPETGAYVGGTGAYKEACERWEAAGYTVKREPNPHYRALSIFNL